MAEIKRTYNIPLRSEYQKAPKYKRAKKAVTALKEFVAKHMKTDDVVIMMELNQLIWKDGIKNPPHHVKVDILKTEDNKAFVQITGLPISTGKEEEKESKKSKKETSKPTEEKKPAKKATAKKVKTETTEDKVEEEKTE